MGQLDGKVAIVTGAGGGIGRSSALQLAQLGASVVVNDAGLPLAHEQVGPRAQDVADEITATGGTAVGDSHDVVDDGGALIDAALGAFGQIDIVVNNAGVAWGGPIGPESAKTWERTIAITIGGSVAVTGAAWPHLIAAGGGRVILTSSAATFGAPGSGAYSLAKSAMLGLTRSLAGEGHRAGIAVNGVMPSAWTRLTKLLPPGEVTELLETHYDPAYVASFVAWLCLPGTAVTGEMFSVGGRRAARIVLGEASGVTVDDADPTSWDNQVDRLMNDDTVGFPRDMLHEVSWQAANLHRPLPAAFEAGGAWAWDDADTYRRRSP